MAKYLDDAALSELVSQIKALVNTKYTKPSGGIPASDLAESYYLASNPSGYTKVESSSTNGNIKINNTETTVYTLPSNVAFTDVANTFTQGQIISRTNSGPILKLTSSASDTNFLLERQGGATCVLESGGSIGLFGTMSNHGLQIRTNYVNRMSFDTSGGVTLATAPAANSNSNQIATTKWVNDKGYITGITSSDVITALGYTPYSNSNPNGYTVVQNSTTNGNIKIDGAETTVYTIPSNVVYWDDTGTTVLETTLLDSYYNKTESDSRFLYKIQNGVYTNITSSVGVSLSSTSLTFVTAFIDSNISTVISNSCGLSIEISTDQGSTWTTVAQSNSINSYPKFEFISALIPSNVLYRWSSWGITRDNAVAFKLELN